MDGDEEFVEEGDLDAARALVASVECADLFLYPGDRHLFAYRSLPSYDEGAATLVMQRVLTFLDKIEQ
jgi:dienelactone hydrolase